MAKKPKLSKNQKRRVAQNRDKRLRQKGNSTELTQDDSLGEAVTGRVISRFGKHAVVEDAQKQAYKCFIRRTIDSVVCGDTVIFRPPAEHTSEQRGIIEIVTDRRSVLTRPDYYDGVKPVAANIDQIFVVSAIVPEFSRHIIDRYIVACEHAGIKPILLVNKVELLDHEGQEIIAEELEVYEALGYRCLLLSCDTGEGIDELATLLNDKVSVFVGQSGVGKSSIVNQLLPNADEVVGEVSSNSGLGQHTTTAAKLLHFKNGGELIDSPGVREFGLWHLDVEIITHGFIEFRQYLGGCKFTDCKHRSDPGCLIVEAVENGDIDEDRYLSYLKIVDSLDSTRPSYAKT